MKRLKERVIIKKICPLFYSNFIFGFYNNNFILTNKSIILEHWLYGRFILNLNDVSRIMLKKRPTTSLEGIWFGSKVILYYKKKNKLKRITLCFNRNDAVGVYNKLKPFVNYNK